MNDTEAQFLDVLYGGVIEGSDFRRALELIQSMFNCVGGALVSVDAKAPVADLSLMSGVSNEHGRLYAEQFIKIDPAPAIFARLPIGKASATDRLMTAKERGSLPFVNDFLRPIGVTETLGGNLFVDRQRFSLIGLLRGSDRPQFDDADIARLERLMPHITRALQLRRVFQGLETKNIALQISLDRLPAGLVLLGSDRDAFFVNAAMQRIAKRGDGVALDRFGYPLLANLLARAKFDALFESAAKGGAGGIITAPRAGGGPGYSILVAPAPASLAQLTWDTPGYPGMTLVVHDPDSRPSNAAEILEKALHLPKSAARVVAALASDDDLKSIADREGVTIHTVRFHLHNALARTGARSQAELVRIAVRLLRDFSLADFQR
jgi:DNA-binding CsgD family transcriptional regulator